MIGQRWLRIVATSAGRGQPWRYGASCSDGTNTSTRRIVDVVRLAAATVNEAPTPRDDRAVVPGR